MAASRKTRARGSDVDRHLLRARSVLLFGTIEPKLTREVVARILAMDAQSAEKPIKVYINSPGGMADDGFAIYDLLRAVRAPVTTIVVGLAASAATIVMVAAPTERRLILPNSRAMLHQPSVGVRGTASDIAISAKEILRLRKKANDLFHRETGQPLKRLESDMHRDFWMNAEECIAYGLVGRILETLADA